MDLNAQLMELVLSLCIGWLLGVLFDAYRVIRNILRPKRFMTAVMDGMYWLVAVVATFTCLLFSNWAEMRFYIFLGIIVGWISYYKFISGYVLFCLIKGVRCLTAMIVWTRKIIMFLIIQPLGYVLGIFSYPFRYGSRKFKKMQIRVKK